MRDVSGRLISACVAGAAILATASASSAQEAGAQSGCSGILCLFSGPSTPASEAPQATEADAAQPPASADNDKGQKNLAPPPKPIVIAANPSERHRLKSLTSILPKQTVKIVDAAGNGSKADFSMSTTVDRRESPAGVKLFTEQMHIVAGGAIRSLKDLNGKVVSFGLDQSASQIAARHAFAALDIQVKETPLDVDNALDGVSSGDIAAVVLLAPRPDERLKRVTTPGLHLVAWPEDGSIPDGAVSSPIDGDDYPTLAKPGEAVRAIGFDAVLTPNPKTTSRPADKKFLAALSQHSAQLSKRGLELLKADPGHRVASAERR